MIIGGMACTKIDPEPPAKTEQRGDIENKISNINLPLVYQVSDLEELINRKIKGVIHNDDSFENNNNDGIKLKVQRKGKIFIAVLGPDVFYNIPLSVNVELKKGILPVIKTDFALRVKLLSRFTINRHWSLRSRTSFLAMDWTKKPKIDIAFASIGITGIVEEAIRGRSKDLTAIIDRHIPQKLDVKKMIAKVWRGIQKPILINKREKRVWLKIDPQSISAGTFMGKNRAIYLKLGIDSYLRTLTGDNPEFDVNAELPPLQNKAEDTDTFNVFVLAKVEFDDLNDVLENNLKGSEFKIKGRTVEVTDAKVYGSDEFLILQADVEGTAKGRVFFRGQPRYDTAAEAFTVDDFDFDVKTKAILVKTANWLLHGNVQEQIRTKLWFPMENSIKILPSLIHGAIEGGSLGEKITLSFKELEIYPETILVSDKNIQALIAARGKAILQLEEFIK